MSVVATAVDYCMPIQYIGFIANGGGEGVQSHPTLPAVAAHRCGGSTAIASEMAMQVLKQRVWSSLNNADAWVLGIGVLSCLGLVTGVLG